MAGGGFVLLLEHIRQWALEWFRYRRLHALARSVMANRNVHTSLVELRTKTDADRSYVVLFHNGQTFSNKNPVWRTSCTQESCKAGVSHLIEKHQNILASLVWDTVAPLFDNKCAPGIIPFEVGKHTVLHVEVDKMDDSFTKNSMIGGGIKTKFMIALHDQKHEIVGLLGVDYCREDSFDMSLIAKEIIQASSNVQYALET
jgi:hypothetical protein